MQKHERVMELQHILWRNMPKYPSTFAPCPRCDKSGGRGGGLCFECARQELGELIGDELATFYTNTLKAVRELETQMERKAAGE